MSASWVERSLGRPSPEGRAPIRGSSSTTVPLALAFRPSISAVRHSGLQDTHEPSLSQGETRVGAGTWGTEEGQGGWNSPNQLPPPSPKGAASRWGVPGQSLPLSLLRHAGNSLKANSSQGGCPLPQGGRMGGVPRVSGLRLGQDSQPPGPTHHLG